MLGKISRTAAASILVLALSGTAASAFFVDAPDAASRAGRPAAASNLDANGLALRALAATLGASGSALEKRDGLGVAAFYAARDFRPAWIADGAPTAAAAAIVARLGAAAEDGLDPADYAVPALASGAAAFAAPEALAATDVALSLAIARFARHAYAGRLDPKSVSPMLDMSPARPEPAAVLTDMATAADPAAALSGYNPTHEQYLRLRTALAEVRAAGAVAQVVVPEGQALKLGVSEERVALLRSRLAIIEPATDPLVFDEVVRDAVLAFQQAHGLTADGIVGRNTLAAMNGNGADREAEIIANMERWRWLPHDLGRFHVQVNIPEFQLTVRRDGATVHRTRVVVGKAGTQTPVFHDEIEHVVVNPYWNVPPSIIANEMMPELRANPGAVAAQYEVFARVDGRTVPVDPWMIDWSQINPRSVSMRQPPGPANALGTVKFLFPNEHDVYLHDTPSKSLFQRDVRAFSHGCVRVQNPWDFAAVLLQEDPRLDVDALERTIGGREATYNLATHVPVYLTYFTAIVDDAGTLQFRSDLYGHSAAVRAALGL